MAKDKKSFVAYSDEGKKIWDDIVNMKWQIHHYYGQSYLSNEEIAKQKDNICTLRRLKEITIDERLLINELLRQGSLGLPFSEISKHAMRKTTTTGILKS